MSVFNGEKYLKECIKSILDQSYTDFEFLIMNDCSNDKTEEIIYDFMLQDTRIKYFKNLVRQGLTKSLNKLISLSSGELIARMDSDDVAFKDRFLNQVRIFEKIKEVDIVFTNASLIDDESKFVSDSWRPSKTKKIIKMMPLHNYIIHPSVMIKKKTLLFIGLYNEDYITGQDHNLWLRMIKSHCKFYYLNKNLLNYRINPNSIRAKTYQKNYSYKLSKVCLANGNKKKALKYLDNLNIINKVDILFRFLFPFRLYRVLIYTKNIQIFGHKSK